VAGQHYFDLLKWCAERTASVGFTVSDEAALSGPAKDVVHAADKRGAVKREVTDWPGTGLQGGTATMYLLPSGANLDLVLAGASELFAWQEPDLPEDLFFLRDDNVPLLTVTAHEEHAYMTLENDELVQLQKDLPWISPMLERFEST
jgi:hypothetical protein